MRCLSDSPGAANGRGDDGMAEQFDALKTKWMRLIEEDRAGECFDFERLAPGQFCVHITEYHGVAPDSSSVEVTGFFDSPREALAYLFFAGIPHVLDWDSKVRGERPLEAREYLTRFRPFQTNFQAVQVPEINESVMLESSDHNGRCDADVVRKIVNRLSSILVAATVLVFAKNQGGYLLFGISFAVILRQAYFSLYSRYLAAKTLTVVLALVGLSFAALLFVRLGRPKPPVIQVAEGGLR